MLQPLKRTRLYEEIIDQILGQIRDGELSPGDRLPPERELAVQMGVSRTAVREALRAMETIGYVESKVGGGTFIRQITLTDVIDPLKRAMGGDHRLHVDLVEVRLLLEPEAAARAAREGNPAKIRAVGAAMERMEGEVAAGDPGAGGDKAFHRAVADASGNAALLMFLDLCGELMQDTQQTTLAIPGQPAKTLADHRRILKAIRAGDEAAASHAMKRHLEKAYLNLRTMAIEGQES
jgi:GntR family transcriptional repressor for pyruvate dehydrogenase complex